MELEPLYEFINWLVETLLVPSLAAVVVGFLWRLYQQAKTYITQRLTNEQVKLLDTIVRRAVRAAEQLYQANSGDQKRKYALQRIRSALAQYGLNVDTETLYEWLESAVLDEFNQYRITSFEPGPPPDPAE